MGKEAQSVPAAAELYKKANDILGYHEIVELFLTYFIICATEILFLLKV